MRRPRTIAVAAMSAAVLTVSGCGFQGLNSLPVPGAQGTGDGSYEITALIPNAANLVQNAPVLMNDATVGSVGKISVRNWKALVTIRLDKGTQVPNGSHVMVGLTSVLGSLNLQVVQPDKPTGGMMKAGQEIPLTACPEQDNIETPSNVTPVADINSAQQVAQCTYPTVEQVLSSLSVVLNGGGLSQIGDVVHELNDTLAGRQDVIRNLVPRLNTLVSDLDKQRANIISAVEGLDRLSRNFNEQSPTIERALDDGPKILKLLVDQRVNLTDALASVGRLSRTTDDILQANGENIETIVRNLSPVLDQLQDSGTSLTQSLNILVTFPFAESVIPKIVKGDYVNAVINLDLTNGRLGRGAFASLGAGAPAAVYGPEAVLGTSAGAAKRGANPFTAPLTDGDDGAAATKAPTTTTPKSATPRTAAPKTTTPKAGR
ncbi:MCE family protein [Williamsia sp.]|uniref:MCE family protein n=1 Tax=Williamsia sp. TaxID=1872085 RepID=UPI001A2D0C47|nr:MCE family protein [Williamsia sp.]MBJ7287691.1 MCE family protein [Williamsia sp.]